MEKHLDVPCEKDKEIEELKNLQKEAKELSSRPEWLDEENSEDRY